MTKGSNLRDLTMMKVTHRKSGDPLGVRLNSMTKGQQMSPKYPKYATDALCKLIDAHARNAPRAELLQLEARCKAVSRPTTPAKFRASIDGHIARALGRNVQTEHRAARDVVDLERERLKREWKSAPED
jgi:hypothetical protein